MTAPSVKYTLVNSTTADVSKLNVNYLDCIAGVSDGKKNVVFNDVSGSNIATNGNVYLGSSSSDGVYISTSYVVNPGTEYSSWVWATKVTASLITGGIELSEDNTFTLGTETYNYELVRAKTILQPTSSTVTFTISSTTDLQITYQYDNAGASYSPLNVSLIQPDGYTSLFNFPIGAIIYWTPNYNAGNATTGSTSLGDCPFWSLMHMMPVWINEYLNPYGWYLCDGASTNITGSLLFSGVGRAVPLLGSAFGATGYTAEGGKVPNIADIFYIVKAL